MNVKGVGEKSPGKLEPFLSTGSADPKPAATLKDLFADDTVDPLEGDDDFDVPSFLK